MNWNGQKAGRRAAFPVSLASFCVRYTSFIALKWHKEIDFLNGLDIHPSPEFFLISLHCSGGHLASVYLCAESLPKWTADGSIRHFSAHQSCFICLISNSLLLAVCTLLGSDCASVSVLDEDYVAIQLDLSIQHAAMLTFLFALGQTITLQLSYINLCLVKGPANAALFKMLQKADTDDRLIAHSTSNDQSNHSQVRLWREIGGSHDDHTIACRNNVCVPLPVPHWTLWGKHSSLETYFCNGRNLD